MMQFGRIWLVGAMMVGMNGPAVAEAPLAKTVQILSMTPILSSRIWCPPRMAY